MENKNFSIPNYIWGMTGGILGTLWYHLCELGNHVPNHNYPALEKAVDDLIEAHKKVVSVYEKCLKAEYPNHKFGAPKEKI